MFCFDSLCDKEEEDGGTKIGENNSQQQHAVDQSRELLPAEVRYVLFVLVAMGPRATELPILTPTLWLVVHLQTRKKYLELITSAKASLLVTSHPLTNQAFSISTKIKDTQSTTEDDDEHDDEQHHASEEVHECKVLCCKTPWTASSSSSAAGGEEIHVVKVTQTGVTTERCVIGSSSSSPSPPPQQHLEGKAVPAPEEAESSLSLDGVKLDVTA